MLIAHLISWINLNIVLPITICILNPQLIARTPLLNLQYKDHGLYQL